MSIINFHNIDCMDFMKSKPDKCYDLAIVDPPYGIGVNQMNMGGRKTVIPSKKTWDNKTPDMNYFKELFRISKNQIIWGGNYFNIEPSQYFAIWDKGETMYGRDFAEAEYAWIRFGRTKIFKKSPNQLDRIHPTQKPIMLYRWLLQNYATKGDKILDTHGGSFTHAIACDMEGFDLDICEIDKEYFDNGVKAFKLYKAQQTLF